MSDTISRTPVVSPAFPVRPVQPAHKNDEQEQGGSGRPPQDDATEHEEVPEADSDESSPTIDEYI